MEIISFEMFIMNSKASLTKLRDMEELQVKWQHLEIL